MSRFGGLRVELEPWAQALYDVAERYGLRPRVTSVFRSLQQQAVLRERYERGQSFLFAARPGESKHQYGLAFDMVCSDPQWLGSVWTSWGGKYYPSDPVHFEV